MNREIKFRAWDSKRNEMRRTFVLDANGTIIRKFIAGTPVGLNPDEAVLMQYTGLRDRNGVEIYEGDILGACVLNGSIVNAQVIFNGGCYLVSALQGEAWAEELFQHAHNEVIGNIHQHSDLLQSEPERASTAPSRRTLT
jgi:uncharacterized phage protein (TIGR01671 family)